MKRKCRIWWPTHLSLNQKLESTFLFGWFVESSSNLLDIVASFAITDAQIHATSSGLQELLHYTNGKMPVMLQDQCTFTLLGYCQADLQSNSKFTRDGFKSENGTKSTHPNEYSSRGKNKLKKYESLCHGCHEIFDRLSKQSRGDSAGKKCFIQLSYESPESIGNRIVWIPKLHHIHWDGQMVSDLDLYVIVYESPRYGSHHFSLGSYNSSEEVKIALKKPMWVEDLHAKTTLPDLDQVILAINSAAAAKLFCEKLVSKYLPLGPALCACSLPSHGNYWPSQSESCVEYAEKAALQKHFMWSNVAVDLLFGNILGFLLLMHTESVCKWISKFSFDITNHLLRMGCVSLMGNPAGFKLNNELAGVLGMVSLNAIQIWSTIWFFLGFYFIFFIEGVAISGILFGLTTPAALIIDLISIATMHVRSLHWLISLLFSQQLQAIAALWRLFRGQKLNPLRQRLDSYDFTVDQHIVGSLLFTPVLLLLPTICAFYIFFAILGTTISVIWIFIEVTISVIHATPYIKIFLWLLRPRRFPFGVWVEISSSKSDSIDNLEIGRVHKVLLFLHCSSLNIGQIILPHYRFISSGVSRSSVFSSAYGILIGRSLPTTLYNFPSAVGNGLPLTLPWMSIPRKEYWRLCHDAVIECRAHCKCHLC